MRLTMLRLNADVVDRVKVYAHEHDLSVYEAASRLLTAGLAAATIQGDGHTAEGRSGTGHERSNC